MALKLMGWVSGLQGEGFYLCMCVCERACMHVCVLEKTASTLTLEFAYRGDRGDGGDDSIERFKCIQVF